MTGTTYAVLNPDGSLNEAASRGAHERQDPASTTKVWTLYTLISMVEDRILPPEFLQENRALIQAMMVHSNNDASQRLATMAARAAGVEIGRVNGALDAVPGFAIYMNYYANPQNYAENPSEGQQPLPRGISGAEHEGNLVEAGSSRALRDSHFYTASGMNHQTHYSSAHDMAMMMFRLRADFAEVPGASAAIEGTNLGNRGSTGSFANGHSEYGKTGTAEGNHGSTGKFAFVGVPRMGGGGMYAIAGARSAPDRIALSRRIAGSINNATGDPLPPLGDAELDRDYLGEDYRTGRDRERARTNPDEEPEIAAEAERRRQAAAEDARQEQEYEARPYQQIIEAIGRLLAAMVGFRSEDNPAPQPDVEPTESSEIIPGTDANPSMGIGLATWLQAIGVRNDALLQGLERGGVTESELRSATEAAVAAGVTFQDPAKLNNLDFDNSGRIDAGDVTALTRIISQAPQARSP